MIRIHNFARGARGLRVAWTCEEMGVPYETATVDFPPAPAYRAMHALGTVPFLEDAGGVAIHESVAMMLYVAGAYGPTPLLPGKDEPQLLARVLELTIFGEASIGAPVNTLLAAHFGAPAEHKANWSVRVLEGRVDTSVAWLTTALGEGPHLAGERFTLADISVSCALGILRGALGKVLPDPLVRYREHLAERPAYQRAVARTQAAAK